MFTSQQVQFSHLSSFSRDFFSELFRRYLQYTAALGSMNPSLGSGGGGGRIPRGKRGRGRRGNHLLSMRCLCLNAMTIVYGRCYAEIGPVSDVPLLVHLLDRTPSAAERDCLITLLEKLVINKVFLLPSVTECLFLQKFSALVGTAK